jgi:hypothetical protein
MNTTTAVRVAIILAATRAVRKRIIVAAHTQREAQRLLATVEAVRRDAIFRTLNNPEA